MKLIFPVLAILIVAGCGGQGGGSRGPLLLAVNSSPACPAGTTCLSALPGQNQRSFSHPADANQITSRASMSAGRTSSAELSVGIRIQ